MKSMARLKFMPPTPRTQPRSTRRRRSGFGSSTPSAAVPVSPAIGISGGRSSGHCVGPRCRWRTPQASPHPRISYLRTPLHGRGKLRPSISRSGWRRHAIRTRCDLPSTQPYRPAWMSIEVDGTAPECWREELTGVTLAAGCDGPVQRLRCRLLAMPSHGRERGAGTADDQNGMRKVRRACSRGHTPGRGRSADSDPGSSGHPLVRPDDVLAGLQVASPELRSHRSARS